MKTMLLGLLLIFSFTANAKTEITTLAGGCFWCVEAPFEKLQRPGIVSAVSGYMGGEKEQANYKDVSAGNGNHIEVVQVTFDPAQISYKEILDIFWRTIDPTQDDGQFVDRGPQYRTVIFYHSDVQKKMATTSREALKKLNKFKKPIVTRILPAKIFYPAEEHHQDYYKKNPVRYRLYRAASGRDRFLEKIWGKK